MSHFSFYSLPVIFTRLPMAFIFFTVSKFFIYYITLLQHIIVGSTFGDDLEAANQNTMARLLIRRLPMENSSLRKLLNILCLFSSPSLFLSLQFLLMFTSSISWMNAIFSSLTLLFLKKFKQCLLDWILDYPDYKDQDIGLMVLWLIHFYCCLQIIVIWWATTAYHFRLIIIVFRISWLDFLQTFLEMCLAGYRVWHQPRL